MGELCIEPSSRVDDSTAVASGDGIMLLVLETGLYAASGRACHGRFYVVIGAVFQEVDVLTSRLDPAS